MTDTIDTYLDEAKRRLHAISGKTVSDREIARRLELTSATVVAWRKRRQLPTDQAMVRLADLAAKSRFLAAMDLNRWRTTEQPVARAVYDEIWEKLDALRPAGVGPLQVEDRTTLIFDITYSREEGTWTVRANGWNGNYWKRYGCHSYLEAVNAARARFGENIHWRVVNEKPAA